MQGDALLIRRAQSERDCNRSHVWVVSTSRSGRVKGPGGSWSVLLRTTFTVQDRYRGTDLRRVETSPFRNRNR